MIVSADVIGVILGIMAAAATIFGGVASLLRGQMRKIDERFAAAEVRNDVRFNKIDDRFDKIDDRFEKLEARIDELAAGLVDVKVAVARLEGPERRLQLLHT